jgi:hypothetical protein
MDQRATSDATVPTVEVSLTRRLALCTLLAVTIVSLPQILIAAVILSNHWDDEEVCDVVHRHKWRMWALLWATRLILHLIVLTLLTWRSDWQGDVNSRFMRSLHTFRSYLDLGGMVWFLTGTMWIFGEDRETKNLCHHPSHSPIYNLCFGMLVVHYIQLCFPCLAIPFVFLVLPRLLRRYLPAISSRDHMGASSTEIKALPVRLFRDIAAAKGSEIDPTCPVCLSEFEPDDGLRVLPCEHHFHLACVDEWLGTNNSCPTCRRVISAHAAV